MYHLVRTPGLYGRPATRTAQRVASQVLSCEFGLCSTGVSPQFDVDLPAASRNRDPKTHHAGFFTSSVVVCEGRLIAAATLHPDLSLNKLIETVDGFDYIGADCSEWMKRPDSARFASSIWQDLIRWSLASSDSSACT